MSHLELFDRRDTHRLIPTKFSSRSVLETLPLPAETLSDLSELDAATNERKVGERGGNAAISPLELVYEVPYAHIINAAFTHAGPNGGRFNDSRRGAWYAGVELDTSIQEVAYHKRLFLKEAGFQRSADLRLRRLHGRFRGKVPLSGWNGIVGLSTAGPDPPVLCSLAVGGTATDQLEVQRSRLPQRSKPGRNMRRLLSARPGLQSPPGKSVWNHPRPRLSRIGGKGDHRSFDGVAICFAGL